MLALRTFGISSPKSGFVGSKVLKANGEADVKFSQLANFLAERCLMQPMRLGNQLRIPVEAVKRDVDVLANRSNEGRT